MSNLTNQRVRVVADAVVSAYIHEIAQPRSVPATPAHERRGSISARTGRRRGGAVAVAAGHARRAVDLHERRLSRHM
jgi:hypothetical protein